MPLCSPAGVMGAILSPAFLLAVRINSKGREVLYLAKGDSVKLGCPYILEPEDNGPQGVGIEWIQTTPERTGPENVVSVTRPGSCHPTMQAGQAGLGWTRWSPAEQAGQARSCRAGKDQAGLAEPGRVWECWAGKDQAGQGRTRQSLAGQGRNWQGRQSQPGTGHCISFPSWQPQVPPTQTSPVQFPRLLPPSSCPTTTTMSTTAVAQGCRTGWPSCRTTPASTMPPSTWPTCRSLTLAPTSAG